MDELPNSQPSVDFYEEAESFAATAAYGTESVNLTAGERPERVQVGVLESALGEIVEVIGFARSSYYRAVGESPRPTLWRDVERASRARTTIIVRAIGDERALLPSIRSAMREIDPSLPLIGFGTLADRVSVAYAAIESSGFGGISLHCSRRSSPLRACTASCPTLRRCEPVRSAFVWHWALAAWDVILLVLDRALVMTFAGVAIGVGMAAGVPMGLDSVLHGISSRDPVTLAIASATFCAIGGVAALLPARRAARTDPMRVLRLE